MLRGGRKLFPVGLYAALLLALCCVIAPPVPRAVQSWLQAAMCLPLRLVPVPVAACAPRSERGAGSRLAEVLLRRQCAAALTHTVSWLPPGFEPVTCQVVERDGRGAAGWPSTLRVDRDGKGAAGWPSVLRLDRTNGELAGCAGFVTYADRLVGFLHAGGAPADRAEVALVHHRLEAGEGRAVAAVAELEEGGLRFVCEPADRLDRWPLRCALIEDPYAASRLRHGGQIVRTAELAADPLGFVPAGLALGRLQIWGYPQLEHSTPIGVFVQPALRPAELAVVVCWRPSRGDPPGLQPRLPRRTPVELLRLPAPPPTGERWLLQAASPLAAGGAIVRGDCLVGRVEWGGSRQAFGVPFAATGSTWALQLMPSDPERAPIGLAARIVYRHARPDGGFVVRLRRVAGQGELCGGTLFTGPNGRHCPAGLLIGRCSPWSGAGADLVVAVPRRGGALDVLSAAWEGP